MTVSSGHGPCYASPGPACAPREQLDSRRIFGDHEPSARDRVRTDGAIALATVLVIEDDPDMRELERTALTCNGHEVMLACNGREGLRELEQRRPCVILLDLMMPVMDGLTFLVERQRRGLGTDVPVVCVSAGGNEIVSRAMGLGAQDCIQKPADFAELCERVDHYCGPGRTVAWHGRPAVPDQA